MNIVPIFAGLGNQMFMYAFYLSLKSKQPNTLCTECLLKKDMAHNGYDLERAFKIQTDRSIFLDIYVKVYRKIHRLSSEGHFYYSKIKGFLSYLGINSVDEALSDLGQYNSKYIKGETGILFFWGYWCTEKYFLDNKKKIFAAFKFNIDCISLKTRTLYERVNLDKNSVSLHVRRGDFVTNGMPLLGNDYYQAAISYIESKVDSPTFYVFSDDIAYVKDNIHISNAEFVTWNIGADSWQDMFLMSSCKHNIIANSSFSWWGAYLNKYESKIVVQPDKFMMNLLSSDISSEPYYTISIGVE